jgi:hypothetical protein
MPDGLVDAIKPFIDYHEEVQVRPFEYIPVTNSKALTKQEGQKLQK